MPQNVPLLGKLIIKLKNTVKNAVICTNQQYICYVSPTYEGKQHDKAISDDEPLTYPKDTKMLLDLGYIGYKAPNLTIILPHKKPYKAELTAEKKNKILNIHMNEFATNIP